MVNLKNIGINDLSCESFIDGSCDLRTKKNNRRRILQYFCIFCSFILLDAVQE